MVFSLFYCKESSAEIPKKHYKGIVIIQCVLGVVECDSISNDIAEVYKLAKFKVIQLQTRVFFTKKGIWVFSENENLAKIIVESYIKSNIDAHIGDNEISKESGIDTYILISLVDK